MLGAIWGLLFAAGVEIALAPDQPAPLVYADEPFIVEMRPSENQTIRVLIEAVDSVSGETHTHTTAPLSLIKDTPYWLALDDFPPDRGHYVIRVAEDNDDGTALGEGTIVKVDRPPTVGASRFVLDVADSGMGVTAVARAGGVTRLSAPVGLAKPLSNDGFTVEARLTEGVPFSDVTTVADWYAEGAADPEGLRETLSAMATAHPGRMPWINLTCTDDLDMAATAVDSVSPRWRIAYADPLSNEYITSLRARAERLGWEHSRWSVSIGHEDPVDWIRAVVRGLYHDCEVLEISADTLWDGQVFVRPFIYCASLTHFIDELVEPIGPMALGDQIEAYLFDTADGWCIAAWAMGDEEIDAALPTNDVRIISATQAVRATHTDNEGNTRVTLSSIPLFIFGDDPAVRAEAAGARAILEAQHLLAMDGIDTLLPDTAVRAITIVDSDEGPVMPRREFLLLLQEFMSLEAQMTQDAAQADRVVPIMAGLTRLVRALCALDQDRGEIFLTPHLTRQDRIKTFQAQYITGGPDDTTNRRGAALNEEIRRLNGLVRAVAARGYTIEADGLAALAEWRARSLNVVD